MNVLELRTELASLLSASLGTYTLPNGSTTPAIAVRSSGQALSAGTTVTGLEVVIIRDPDLTPIPQYADSGALRSWTVFLVDWSDAVDLEPIGAYIVEAYAGTAVSTLAVPKGTGPQNQMRITIQSNAEPPSGFPAYDPVRFPTVDALGFTLDAGITPSTGQLTWNADEGTLELGKPGGISNYLGQETMLLCRNNSNSVTIPKGTAVMFAGTLGASGRIKVAPMVSNGSLPGYVFFGVTDQAIAGAADGYVTTFGKIKGINTSAYVDGDILWCNPAVAGGLTKVEPQAPNLKLAVAAVVRATNNGTIFVRSTAGARLRDLHDVEVGSPTNDQVLTYKTATARWEAATVPLPPVSPLLISQQIIAENYTVTSGYNGISAGDVDVAATYTVTVPAGATWVIV